ncbi:MAG TPA: dihydrofolate reductase, partial [Candidatus Cloacimonas sp.]|nr:dihydrofolate reductase [Candidatus Cloacimonas sp.]
MAAYDLNRIIGKNGKLPWKIPEDLSRFKSVTMGHPVIMGKKTWNSLGKPLPGRQNIVLSKDQNFQP